jgi:putative membrane protein
MPARHFYQNFKTFGELPYKNLLVIIVICNTLRGRIMMWGNWPNCWHGMWGWWGFGSLIHLLFIALIIFIVIRLFTGRGLYNYHQESSLEILKKRYAKGEISKEEFEKIKKDIAG